jgi:hypothetical protein
MGMGSFNTGANETLVGLPSYDVILLWTKFLSYSNNLSWMDGISKSETVSEENIPLKYGMSWSQNLVRSVRSTSTHASQPDRTSVVMPSSPLRANDMG